MCFRGRIQVKANLKAKGWPGIPSCRLCGELETANHMIFGCPLSHFQWWWVKEAFRWERPPQCFEDFLCVGLNHAGSSSNHIGWAIFGALACAIWLARNDLVFNDKICSSPLNNIFKMFSMLSQSTPLALGKPEAGWKDLIERMEMALKKYHFLLRSRSGVG